jgi:hypothetical protein
MLKYFGANFWTDFWADFWTDFWVDFWADFWANFGLIINFASNLQLMWKVSNLMHI